MSDTTITPEERQELRKLHADATPGPWTSGGSNGFGWIRIPCKNMLGLYNQVLFGDYNGAAHDARYATVACHAVPRLLTALEAAEAESARLTAQLAALTGEQEDCKLHRCPYSREGLNCGVISLANNRAYAAMVESARLQKVVNWLAVGAASASLADDERHRLREEAEDWQEAARRAVAAGEGE